MKTKREQVLSRLAKKKLPVTGREICEPLGFTNWGGVFSGLIAEGLVERAEVKVAGVLHVGYRLVREETRKPKVKKTRHVPKKTSARGGQTSA
jgi:hypothetical protein